MHIYSVVIAENLRLFEPFLIEDPEEQSQLPSIDDLLPEYLNELQEDTVLDKKVRTTRKGDVEYFRIGLKGSKPSSAKWIEIRRVIKLYPHLVDAWKPTFGGRKAFLVGRPWSELDPQTIPWLLRMDDKLQEIL